MSRKNELNEERRTQARQIEDSLRILAESEGETEEYAKRLLRVYCE